MEYTLDELVGAVTARLRAAGLDHQTNGQVSAFPDRRTLRYYTTIGLMDRPETVRDRQAIYGDRHVTQAVAVKRLQATGLALAAIQHHLTGLPLPQVEAIAAGRAFDSADGASTAGRRRFWAAASPAPAVAAAPAVSGALPMLAIALSARATLLYATDQPLTPGDIAGIRGAASGLLSHIDQLSAADPTGADLDRKDHR